ncbi:MAG: saccharopine dehydrogenase NADP-binding domain-containing protein [Bacteroidetes bacterium]|nr:saccharopine dehydrogenase NADP-binding domain-containing protein [Bacteroidota bacterium]
MSSIIVLGAGMVGSAMAIDLAKKHSVTVTDIDRKRLEHVKAKCPPLTTAEVNVRDAAALRAVVAPFDLVICAVPGFLGFTTVRKVIDAGKNIVDISFFPENALELDALAKERGVTAIVDCGVAPGMHNFIIGRYNELLQLTDVETLVGGLPKVRRWPFYYKAPFSPVDVIEEYTRPARFVENGHTVVREALSDSELMEFARIGTLEAFNTDGLRSLIHTMPQIRNMKEKTLRYPGHIDMIKALKASGFFNSGTVRVQGTDVSPLDVTSAVLFDEWKLGETEPELTVMRVTMKGRNASGATEQVVYDLYDEYDPETQTSSMARTTGYTATAAASMFLEGLFAERGVFPPELIGKHEQCFDYVVGYLADRNVRYTRTSRIIQ